MDNLEHVIKLSNKLLEGRENLLQMWQILAEQFYPERADFTVNRALGEDYGSHLMSSYPVLARRDLGNALSSMLRPTNKEWFHQRTKQNWNKVGVAERTWLEAADATQRRAMYHVSSGFSRAVKEADHDFSTFGQAVLEVALNKNGNGLQFHTRHLRDCAWMEDETGRVTTLTRKWMPTLHSLSRMFPGKLHPRMTDKLQKEPFGQVEIIRTVMPSELCGGGTKYKHPYMSYYIDTVNQHVLEEVGLRSFPYVVPRWQTVSGSQYAVSPATCVALADARLLQAMIGILLDAGEKAVDPPMVANKDVFGGNFAIYAGGLTWADMADGRISDHFQMLTSDKSGIPLGLDMARDVRAQIAEAFFLNKLSLPPPGQDMTAYEVGQRVQEYIRQAMPLFEPMEYEYNAPLCDISFDLLMRSGAFGSPLDIPKGLRGVETEFTFESPLHDAVEKAKAQTFMEAHGMTTSALQLDPGSVHVIDIKEAFRDALSGSGVPSSWLRSKEQVEEIAGQELQAQQMQEALAQAQQSADVNKTIAETPTEQM